MEPLTIYLLCVTVPLIAIIVLMKHISGSHYVDPYVREDVERFKDLGFEISEIAYYLNLTEKEVERILSERN